MFIVPRASTEDRLRTFVIQERISSMDSQNPIIVPNTRGKCPNYFNAILTTLKPNIYSLQS